MTTEREMATEDERVAAVAASLMGTVNAPENMIWRVSRAIVHMISSGYEAALDDHRRLVRDLDVALNGEDGAAKQASLCDVVSQVKDQRWKLVRTL